MNFSIGSSACQICVTQIQKRNAIGVELYINDDKELSKSLYAHKAEIETDRGIIYIMDILLKMRKAFKKHLGVQYDY